VTVVGIGADGWSGLPATSRSAIADGDLLVGSPRQLDLVPEGVGGRRVTLPSPLHPGLSELLDQRDDSAMTVLASGDPMFHGLGSTLVRLLGPEAVNVLPHPSSVSLAAARLGWALDDVEVVSLVGRPLATLHPVIQPGRRVLVLVSEATGGEQVRGLLEARGFGASEVTLLSDLGGPAESVRPAIDEPHSPLTIVAVDCVADPGATVLSRTPGLPEETFEQDGQITKREIRAIALAALNPIPGQVLWDVGAGSGSIGIEWMRAHPSSRAFAVEPRQDRRDAIGRNAAALGVPALEVMSGEAPAALASLPGPDAVFIGGGVTAPGVVDACWDALATGGRLVAHAVTIESEQVLVASQRRLGGSLTRISVARAGELGRFNAWRPAIPVVQWAATKA
jgi:precorrin-6Y C5,15-methyltransferase (decarboxylating)